LESGYLIDLILSPKTVIPTIIDVTTVPVIKRWYLIVI